MKRRNLWIIAGLASSLMAMSAPSFATTWTSGGTGTCGTNNGLSNSCSGTSGGTSLVVTAISDSGTGNNLAGGYIGYYATNHWGVTTKAGRYSNGNPRASNEAQSSPNHAMDNEGNQEWLFYSFGADVNLTAVTLGWSGTDSDITVMAYEPTGPQPPGAVPANGSTTDSGINGLVSKGWVAIGNYMNVGTGTANISAASAGVYSSYWLIGAYNSLGGGNYKANGDNYTSSADSSFDYVKVLSVAGTTQPTIPSTNNVPEASSLLLAAIALLGLTALRRRRTV